MTSALAGQSWRPGRVAAYIRRRGPSVGIGTSCTPSRAGKDAGTSATPRSAATKSRMSSRLSTLCAMAGVTPAAAQTRSTSSPSSSPREFTTQGRPATEASRCGESIGPGTERLVGTASTSGEVHMNRRAPPSSPNRGTRL
ncbi:MAG TPA: hypothetical protein VGJ44_20545 [Kribbellaceae bacterium]